jgi:hypothetical protein
VLPTAGRKDSKGGWRAAQFLVAAIGRHAGINPSNPLFPTQVSPPPPIQPLLRPHSLKEPPIHKPQLLHLPLPIPCPGHADPPPPLHDLIQQLRNPLLCLGSISSTDDVCREMEPREGELGVDVVLEVEVPGVRGEGVVEGCSGR